MADRIQQRRDTAARWAEYNPILLEGEIGWVTDNPNQYKIGDGVNAWNALPLRGYSGTVAQTIGTDEKAVLSQAATSKLSGLNKFLTFNPSYNYSKGEPIIYDGLLYKFTEAHPAGVWLGTDVVEISLKEVVDDDIFNIYGSQLFVDGYYVLMSGSVYATSTNGFGATDFLPITGKEDITVICGWLNTSANITPMAFYDENKQFLGAYTEPSNESTCVYTTKAADIPAGAKFVRCTSNKISTSAYQKGKPKVIGVDFASLLGWTNQVQTNLEESYKNLSSDAGFSEFPDVIQNTLYSTSADKGNWVKNMNWDAAVVKIYDGSTRLGVNGIPINSNILACFFRDLDTNNRANFISSNWLYATDPVTNSASVSIPSGAKVAILDIPKANNVEGYANLRVTQEGSGASKFLVDNYRKQLSGSFLNIQLGALRENGNIEGNNTGFGCSDFLPITGKEPIRVEGGWRLASSQITPIAFYDEYDNFISCYMGDDNNAGGGVYEYSVDQIPSGAKQIRVCTNIARWPNACVYGVSAGAIEINSASKLELLNSRIKEGSFSGQPAIEFNHLANISEESLFTKYIYSNSFDCAWVAIYDGATTMEVSGANVTLYAWFSSTYPSVDTFIKITSGSVGSTIEIPAGAKLAIIDLNKANNPAGYDDFRVTQKGFGAVRNEDLESIFKDNGLIKFEDGDSLDMGQTIDGYVRSDGSILITSDYVHQDVVIPDDNKYYHVNITRWPQSSDGVYFFVCYDSSGSSIGYFMSNPVPGYGLNEVLKFPRGTAKVSVNWRSNNPKAPTINIAVATPIDIEEMESEVEKHDDILRQKTYTPVEKTSEVRGQFINASGNPQSNGAFHYTRYEITDSTLDYRLSSGFGSNTGIAFVHYYNSEGVWLGSEYYTKTPVGGSFVLDRAILHFPNDTAYILVNCSNAYTNKLEIVTVGDYYDLGDLSKPSSGLMKVHIYGETTSLGTDLFYVRTSYNKSKTKDIIILYYTNLNGLISPKSAYVGPSDLEDKDLMVSTYLMSTHSDSTAPFFQSSVYWHLYAQHGYVIPVIPNSNNMVTDDIGAIWKDQLDRQFVIGNVTASLIYLLPIFDTSGGEGHDTRSWQTPLQTAVNALTHVSGGITTTAITGATQSTVQLRPIMDMYNRKYVIDGNVITQDGDFWCDDFQVSESQIGYDPATVAQNNWFPTPGVVGTPNLEGALEMARFTWSYNFKGATCCVNTTVDVRRKLECQSYGATQQQTFFDKGSYKAMFMIPKAATQSGVEIDKPFNSPASSSRSFVFFRNATYLKDVDKPIDRLIAFLHDENTDDYAIGMAAGLSLVSGDTVPEKRNLNIPVAPDESNAHYRLGSFSPSNTNKFYIAAVNTSNFASDDYNFPNTYFKEINYYVSYFDPADNVGQVYWYKDGDHYVVYAHCQSVQSRIPLEVPEYMEGLTFEIVEKTDGAELLSGTVQNGKLFVNYNTDEANYIVLKSK